MYENEKCFFSTYYISNGIFNGFYLPFSDLYKKKRENTTRENKILFAVRI